MMLTPCWPSAGPTGGEGALPAGICSFTIAYFFATQRLLERGPGVRSSNRYAAERGDEHVLAAFGAVASSDHALETTVRALEIRTLSPTFERPASVHLEALHR
jgi:hypothetical protein